MTLTRIANAIFIEACYAHQAGDTETENHCTAGLEFIQAIEQKELSKFIGERVTA